MNGDARGLKQPVPTQVPYAGTRPTAMNDVMRRGRGQLKALCRWCGLLRDRGEFELLGRGDDNAPVYGRVCAGCRSGQVAG